LARRLAILLADQDMKILELGLFLLLFFQELAISDISHFTVPDDRKKTVEKDGNGNISSYIEPIGIKAGCRETKVIDKDGNVTQWYQSFLDEKGHEILSISRKSPGNRPNYGGIEDIWVRTYNSDGNVNEEYDYWGNGVPRSHAINIYNKSTKKWMRADAYSPTGVFLGSVYTPNEEFLYGEKNKK
jgi:hypothetical protein